MTEYLQNFNRNDAKNLIQNSRFQACHKVDRVPATIAQSRADARCRFLRRNDRTSALQHKNEQNDDTKCISCHLQRLGEFLDSELQWILQISLEKRCTLSSPFGLIHFETLWDKHRKKRHEIMKVNLERTTQTCNHTMWKMDESGWKGQIKTCFSTATNLGWNDWWDWHIGFCDQDDTGKCFFDGLNLWAIQRQVTMSCRIWQRWFPHIFVALPRWTMKPMKLFPSLFNCKYAKGFWGNIFGNKAITQKIHLLKHHGHCCFNVFLQRSWPLHL